MTKSVLAALTKTKGVLIAMKKNLCKIQTTAATSKRAASLRFSPTAWSKLLFLRDAGDTEIGGFGITVPEDLLFVNDIRLVKQTCTWAHVEFHDQGVAELFDEQVDAGRRPEQFARIWIHTHPGQSPAPSGTDEATFARVFGRSDWAVMFILARGGESYARLRYNVGPGADMKVPVDIDFTRPFLASNAVAWKGEYDLHVHQVPTEPVIDDEATKRADGTFVDDASVESWWRDAFGDYVDFERVTSEANNDIRDND